MFFGVLFWCFLVLFEIFCDGFLFQNKQTFFKVSKKLDFVWKPTLDCPMDGENPKKKTKQEMKNGSVGRTCLGDSVDPRNL